MSNGPFIEFGAGPAKVPEQVLVALHEADYNFMGSGRPLDSINHRGALFEEMHAETIRLVRELLRVPDGYTVLFVPGGATSQMNGSLLNILPWNEPELPEVGYIDAGHWGNEAVRLGDDLARAGLCTVHLVDSTRCRQYREYPLPDISETELDYLHLVTNETVNGVMIRDWDNLRIHPNTVLVADMTSEIMSRPVPIERFGVIYAGTQKNLGVPGETALVIIRNDLIRSGHPLLPAPLRYAEQIRVKGGLRNTPTSRALYSVNLTLKWIQSQGGVEAMERLAIDRANLLYDFLYREPASRFYEGIANIGSRSRMNVIYRVRNPDWRREYLAYCEDQGLMGLRGHAGARAYLGECVRASLYNCMTLPEVIRLIEVSSDFILHKSKSASPR